MTGLVRKMDDKTIGHWKRRLTELDEKIKKLQAELEENQNLKLKSRFEEPELDEKISYLKEWIDFNVKEKAKYEVKLRSEESDKPKEFISLEEEPIKESAAFELVFGRIEEEKTKTQKKSAEDAVATAKTSPIPNQKYQPLFKYAISFALLLLVVGSLFFIKPEITGQAVLSKETGHSYSLNLKINETGNYTWELGKPLNIKSVKATGRVAGNGSVKVYIEKDGKKYLIYTQISSRNTKFY